MAIAIVTGSGGLIGSEAVRFFAAQGFDVIGLENDMRARFFGPEASTTPVSERLVAEVDGFRWERCDIRDADGVARLFARHAREIELIVHAAAQPSHDWAASDPQTDFAVNANGTLNLLEAARAADINISATLEAALADQLRIRKRERWRADNVEAIEAYNSDVDKNGSFGDHARGF